MQKYYKFSRNLDVQRRIFKIEKRLVFLVFLAILSLVIFAQAKKQTVPIKNSAYDEKKEAYLKTVIKLKGTDGWKPKGGGEHGEIINLPLIRAGTVINLESGDVLWSKNLDEKIAPASLTKLASIMTALDVASGGDLITVSRKASEQIPTKLGLSAGETLTLEEAIDAAILTSANDATEAIADSLGQNIGGETAFVNLVNEKLARIGAIRSHFETVTGLDAPGHFSTVSDLAIIAHEAKKDYPLISAAAALEYKRLSPNQNHKLYDLPNWNALLGTYPGVDGLKIGYTEAAGHSTIVTATREGKSLVAIVVGASSVEDREISAATLLNFGFSKYEIYAYPVSKLDLVRRFEDWRRQLSYNFKK